MKPASLSRPLLFFYILVIYVLLQFSWWAYLLIDLNREVYGQAMATGSDEAFSNFDKKKMMVLGEGLVFLAILVFGIYKTREAFRKEFALARQQRNFLLSVTHEFKSPLSAIKLGLQTIQKRDLDPSQLQKLVGSAIHETDRIHMLLEDTLTAARIESRNFELNMELVDWSDCCTSVAHRKSIEWEGKRQLQVNVEDGIRVQGDQQALISVLVNLLDNADKYSPKEGVINIQLKSNENEAVLSVSDNGPGVPASERQAVFQKFYRLGNEETRRTTGTGLGLYIVKNLVNLHRGKVTIGENHPSGAVFRVTLPLS
ncbi:MAG: sensor histidine kinase [Arcticibacter sp.]